MDFLIRYPEFSGVEKPRLEMFLHNAGSQMSKKVWGKLYAQGRHALAAHLLYVYGSLRPSGSGNGKPVQAAISKTAGGLSVSYSAPDAGFGAGHQGYASSSYGQTYIRLRALTARHMLVIR